MEAKIILLTIVYLALNIYVRFFLKWEGRKAISWNLTCFFQFQLGFKQNTPNVITQRFNIKLLTKEPLISLHCTFTYIIYDVKYLRLFD